MGSDDPTQAKRVWGHPEGARPKGVSDTITICYQEWGPFSPKLCTRTPFIIANS